MFSMADFIERHGGHSYNNKNWTMNCPRCGKGNDHFMVSIDRKKPVFYCYKCQWKGGWTRLLMAVEGISYDDACERLENTIEFYEKEKEEKEPLISIPLPPVAKFSDDAIQYLHKRNIDTTTIEQFGIYFCDIGKYANRIIIPIYYKHRQITFQARSIYPGTIRYLTPKGSQLGRLLFNYDSIPEKAKKVVVVEGIFDTIRLVRFGWNTVASFGKKISEHQIQLLREKNIQEVVLYWDADASEEIKKAFIDLQRYFNVSMALIEEGDPDSYENPSLPIQFAIDNLDDFYNFQMQSFSSKINTLDKALNF